ncbi:MAG: universal stress protein [Bacteroidia bacterium]|nr:universal stress protein [Bacteroidia bacterium]NNJ55916.1 universal stress protein [Bacteroidia bacterium]
MNILIPTDFSDNSIHAINYVYSNFQKEHIDVTLVHAIKEPQTTAGVLIRLEQLMMKDAEKDMKNLLKKVNDDYQQKPKHHIEYGYLKDWIDIYAKAHNIDVIVMGTKGESNVRSIIMGSITESVIRTSKLPVFAIPEFEKELPVHQFILATNKKELERVEFIQKFLDNLKLSSPNVDVLVVLNEENRGGLPKSFPLNGFQIGVKTVENESVVDGINDYLANNKVDILGLYHSRNSRLDYLFNRSVTKTICGETRVPLLVIPGS